MKNNGGKVSDGPMDLKNILSPSVLSVCLIHTSLCVGEEFVTSCHLLPGRECKKEEGNINEVLSLKYEKEKKHILCEPPTHLESKKNCRTSKRAVDVLHYQTLIKSRVRTARAKFV